MAASGGRDSTALLHCTLRSAQSLGLRVLALHVHHGLMPEADAWLAQVGRQARRWGAGFDSRRLAGAPQAGDSIEAWARRERYAALAEMAHAAGASLVLLAHHRRDQAETWLLQALRGGGPAGLAAMPRLAQRQGLVWARPWLEQPRSAIDDYLRRHRLRAVDDGSNADTRYGRSRLRQQVWPRLQVAFPDAEQALAQSSRRAQEAAALAAEVAALDLPPCTADAALLIAPWLALPPARRVNALRAWLAGRHGAPVAEVLVQRLLLELPGRRSARFPAPGGELRLYRGALAWTALEAVTEGPFERDSAVAPPLPASRACTVELNLSRAGAHAVPGWPDGELWLQPCAKGGLPVALLHAVLVLPRRGGEQFQRAPRTPPRSLKKQFQAAGVPAWQRQAPLLSTPGGALLFVPGLGVDARCMAQPGAPQFSIEWRASTGLRQPAP